MKKVINFKEMMIILISVLLLVTATTKVFATDVLGTLENNTNSSTVNPDDYKNAQTPTIDNNTTPTGNNTTNNVTNNTTNSARTYNTNNSSDLPQTGIEDYNVGILLVICVASAIFAYKKVKDYKNI